MGLQQKLDREYLRGYEDGKRAKNEIAIKMARNDAFILGSQSTWNLLAEMIPKLEGIGPKTRDKVFRAIQQRAKKEKERLQK